MTSLLTVVLILAALHSPVRSVTLQEGKSNPQKYIYYDTDEFNPWIHLAISLPILYAILIFIWSGVTLYMKLSGKSRQRRQ
ncbi:hypothetical protein BOX15_Mlig019061g1 [Macrostomum lignano]|uniref:Uncharacterized protein n=1 Tax=Macrostomum lignano TaxID=282301 RepID=A0A267FEU5_9PLAT|nr:hypothetical protein BOX15_Mlig019061g1 [Macrostomum lignano]